MLCPSYFETLRSTIVFSVFSLQMHSLMFIYIPLQLISNMKYQILLFSSFLLALALFHYPSIPEISHFQPQFKDWMQTYQKNYQSSAEYYYRLSIFAQNLKVIEEHNLQAQKGLWTYFLGLNAYADQTKYEFKLKNLFSFNRKTSSQIKSLSANTKSCNGSIQDTPNPPEHVDWSTKAVVSNVYAQSKQCPTNWAFATTGAIEGLYAIRQQKLTKLSDQQLIDCSDQYGNEGCGGGFMEQAFWYIIDHGITTNQTYPYIASQSGSCKYSLTDKYTKISRCARIPSGNYSKLLSASVQQPVAVALDSANFYLYSHGIFNGQCGQSIDRGMLLVGYGSENNSSFWKIKNSMGKDWGEDGYIRLEKIEEDGSGKCGLHLAASIPQGLV